MGKVSYSVFTVIMLILVVLLFYTPYLAHQGNDVKALYNPGFSWACHQKISRSLCLFADGNGNYFVADCVKQVGEYIPNDNRIIRTIKDGLVGYKIPVCARDIGIYGTMLLAALMYPLVRKLDDANVPAAIWLLLALVPIGIDGGLQLVSELGIFGNYESTNLIRIITGGIAGFVLPFYILPLYNYHRWKGKKNAQ